MCLPAVTLQASLSGFGFTTDLCRLIVFERSVNSTVFLIFQEHAKLFLHVNSIPELRLVKKLTTNGPNQALHKWMRNGCIRDDFDGVNFKDMKVRLPSVILEKWIIRA